MKLNKKFMSLFAVLLVSAGILAACGNDNNDTDNNDVETQEEAGADADAEVVTGASESELAGDLVEVLANGANWMFAAQSDMTLEEDLVVEAGHHRRNDSDNELARKLALYTQNREEVDGEMVVEITGEFTLTVPTLVVEAENFNLMLGTIDGDVIVDANDFHLNGATITGNLIFTSEEYKESANLVSDVEDFDSEVLGEISVEDAE